MHLNIDTKEAKIKTAKDNKSNQFDEITPHADLKISKIKLEILFISLKKSVEEIFIHSTTYHYLCRIFRINWKKHINIYKSNAAATIIKTGATEEISSSVTTNS